MVPAQGCRNLVRARLDACRPHRSSSVALEAGLISEIAEKPRILERAVELARDIAAGTAPVSVSVTRKLMWQGLGASSPETAHQAESRALFERGRSADVREGVAAFLEKRSPIFVDTVTAAPED